MYYYTEKLENICINLNFENFTSAFGSWFEWYKILLKLCKFTQNLVFQKHNSLKVQNANIFGFYSININNLLST